MKISGGRMFANPPGPEIQPDMIDYMETQLKPTRAFADTTQSVVVGAADLSNVAVSLPETKLPPPKPLPNPADTDDQ